MCRSATRLLCLQNGRNILVDVLQKCCGTPAELTQKRKKFADVSQNRKKIADLAQNGKRFTNVSRNRKRRAAGWDGHVRARKISERAKKIQKEKYDETIQKPSIESEG